MNISKHRSKLKTVLAGMLLLIFSMYYVNSTLFYHQHTIKGEKVSHSHFFSKVHTESSKNGNHTVEIVKLISVLNNIVVESQNFDSHLEAIEGRIESVIRAESTAPAKFYLERCRSLRAPPRA